MRRAFNAIKQFRLKKKKKSILVNSKYAAEGINVALTTKLEKWMLWIKFINCYLAQNKNCDTAEVNYYFDVFKLDSDKNLHPFQNSLQANRFLYLLNMVEENPYHLHQKTSPVNTISDKCTIFKMIKTASHLSTSGSLRNSDKLISFNSWGILTTNQPV